MDPDIKPVGGYDADLDLFESQYVVSDGISYNSYIIADEKPVIIDTVDRRIEAEWRANVRNFFDRNTPPAYIIVQHLEPDHSSQIDWVMATYPDCRMVCTAVARKMLPLVADPSGYQDRIIEVGDGDTLSLGKHELTFFTAPMVHWPEVMMTYDATSATLFSADGFGRFGNPDPSMPWAGEARRYYFNIVGKYGLPVQTVLRKLQGKEIKVIAPLHGPVLEGDLSEYMRLYKIWATYDVETPGVFIAYASIHGFTAVAARELEKIFTELRAPKVKIADLSRSDMADAVEEAFRMSHLVVMSPTYDAEIFPVVHDFVHHLAIKGYRDRRVAIVENGLWAPAAGRKLHAMFELMKDITIVDPVVTLRGRMTSDDVTRLRSLATSLLGS